MESAIEDVEFLGRSPARVQLLVELTADGARSKYELRERIGVDRTTIQRTRDALVERGRIHREGDDYVLDPCAVHAIDAVLLTPITGLHAKRTLRDRVVEAGQVVEAGHVVEVGALVESRNEEVRAARRRSAFREKSMLEGDRTGRSVEQSMALERW